MNTQTVLNLNQNIHELMNKYDQELERDVDHLVRKHAIDKPEDLACSFENLTEDNRLLQVGVVGRVKAGKSSLLNALVFDGQNILPRAATPMTAALTTLTYGESFSAKVQFYSEADLQNIEINARRFNYRLEEERKRAADNLRRTMRRSNGRGLENEDPQFWDHVEKTAKRAAQVDQSLTASHDQWERICKSGVDRLAIDKLGKLEAKDAHSLAEQLLEYVGAHGRYMPLTKSVDIFLPLESLRDIRIIDTPGLNDPVRSREERTTKLLKDCDVVFIVSPAGQFLSEQDLEVMSRITQKEGVQELVLIASQVDNQLYGTDTRRPTLRDSLETVTEALSRHMVSTLRRLKIQHPEIGSTFDGLIQNDDGKILYTSGICQGLSVRFYQPEQWDSGERKVWENLQANYQDFFPQDKPECCRENLDLLANTAALQDVLKKVREQKDRIVGQRRTDLIRAKLTALEAFRSDLLKFARAKSSEIKNADIDDLKMQQRKLNSKMTVATFDLNSVLRELKLQFLEQLPKQLMTNLKTAYGETENAFNSAGEQKNKTCSRDKSGIFPWFARHLWDGGKEDFTSMEFKLFLTPVRNAIQHFAEELTGSLRNSSKDLAFKFRKKLVIDITGAARKHFENDVSPELIINSAEGITSKIAIPPFVLDSSELHNLKGTGNSLRDSAAREFMDDAETLMHKLKGQAEQQIRHFSEDIAGALPESIGNDVFQDMLARIKQLEGQVENAQLTLDRFERMARDLEVA
jgi:hypothetical protein